MTIGIIDYGMGNLASVERAFAEVGAKAVVLSSPDEITGAERFVLPGVGSFRCAMENLRDAGWVDAIGKAVRDGQPFLGICLGMQLLADKGTEHGDCAGLGLISGEIVKFDFTDDDVDLRVPHVGWNEILYAQEGDALFNTINEKTDFYFVHSYYFAPSDEKSVVCRTPYGFDFASVVREGHVWGTQFHPEKSGVAGLQILKNFAEL